MNLPTMPNTTALKKSTQTSFGGYKHTEGAGDGDIYDMLNMTSDHYPVLASRSPRYYKDNIEANNGLIYIDDEAYYVNDTILYHDSHAIGTLTDTVKKFAVMPYYLVIFPDKKVIRLGIKGYYATLAALSAAITTPSANDRYGVGANPYTIYYWDITTSPAQWTELGNEVEPMESTWSGALTFLATGEYKDTVAYDNTLYSASTNWSDYFREGDAVTIDGCTKHTENNKTPIIREIDGPLLRFYENIFVLDKEWYLESTKDNLFVFADYQSTSPYYTNLKSFYFKTDQELIIFQPNPALETVPSDTDLEKVYIRTGNELYYKDKKLYYLAILTGNKTELVSYSVYDKVNLIGADIMYTAKNITVSQKKYYYTLDNQTCVFTLTNEQYATVGGKTCDFILFKSLLNSGGQLFIQNDSIAIDFSVEPVTLGELAGFLSSDINYIESAVTLKRTVPDMDFILGHENRLWGGKEDTIYASKLGDPFNFNVFDTLSTDSFSVQTGTHGDFTGLVSYISYPIFFKEDHIFKIYGDVPEEFTIYDSSTSGVKAGSEDSFGIAGETLYYQSKAGIMAYTGGVPSLISANLGKVSYKNGIGGSDGNKYYLDTEDTTGVHHLFVYDPVNGLWHKEETEGIIAFLKYQNETWVYDSESMKTLSAMDQPTGTTKETAVDWMVEFADIIEDSPNKKGVAKLQIRCELTGTMTVKLKFDSTGEWETRGSLTTQTKQSKIIPIIPKRNDHFRIKLEGSGAVKITSLSIYYYGGSDQ